MRGILALGTPPIMVEGFDWDGWREGWRDGFLKVLAFLRGDGLGRSLGDYFYSKVCYFFGYFVGIDGF